MKTSIRRRARFHFLHTEPLELRTLLSSTSAVPNLGSIDHTTNTKGKLTASEADQFQFTVQSDERIAFDLDPRGKGTFPGTIKIYDAQGNLLAENIAGTGPRESDSSGYLEFTFPDSGKYTLAVSTSAVGKYTLQVTALTQTVTPLNGNTIRGELALPNRQQHLKTSPVFLQRVDENGNPGLAIQTDVRTWIVVHGRIDSADSFRSLAGSLVRETGDQVLVLDWSKAAHDNTRSSSLNGAEWIPNIGTWVSTVLKELQISGDQTLLVGHSWGSYVAYDVAQKMGTVQSLVALDPAYAGDYPYQQIDFSAVSHLSWAIYAEDPFGSAALSQTADEAFGLEYLGTQPDIFARHDIPVEVFQSLIDQSHDLVPFLQGLLTPNRLISATPTDVWKLNQYAEGSPIETPFPAFEGLLQVQLQGGVWQVAGLRYVKADTGVEVTV